jgi:hypothetical protein
MKNGSEFQKFDSTMRKLIAVPHSEIKAKLEAEKAEKAKKKVSRDKTKGESDGR